MKVEVNGKINKYYVQTLCMVFFPGIKFSDDEDDGYYIKVDVTEFEDSVEASAFLDANGKISSATKKFDCTDGATRDKTIKTAVGAAVIAAAGDLVGYRPSWGMLVGVRPSKVATDLLMNGNSKTRTKKILNSEYFVIPKKAALVTEVALNEAAVIGERSDRDCSVYISIPFCPSRCAYCSFVSYTSQRLLSMIPEYLERLMRR